MEATTSGKAEIDIKMSVDAVWQIVGDFGGVDRWIPGADSCEVVGDVRIVGSGDLSVTEQLLARDELQHTITYALTAGMPLDHHRATISVSRACGTSDLTTAALTTADLTHVSWTVEVAPAPMTEVLVGHYRQALEALKAILEG